MEPEEILVDYEQLEVISNRFSIQAEIVEQIIVRVRRSLESISNGGWTGVGSDAFLKEMESEILPACNRLMNFLNEASSVTRESATIMQRAEDEAQRLFSSN